MIVAEWIPIVQELQARGIGDPVMLVGVLASYDLPLESGERVIGRLPRAFATVASVLARDAVQLKTAYVARAATTTRANALMSEVKALESKLDRLPGVVGQPRFEGVEPAQMARYAKTFAAQEGLPLPAESQASPDWLSILQVLRSRGVTDPDVALFVLHRTRLRLKSGAVVEPLEEDARYLTVATAFGLEPGKYRQEFFMRVMHAGAGGNNPLPAAKEARAILATLPDVEIEEVALARPPDPVKEYREGDESMAPPWEAFPEPPTSLRWRMGAGEDHLDRWVPYWRGLPEPIRRDYLMRHPPPPEWKEWLNRI